MEALKEKDLFTELGLQVTQGDVEKDIEVGKTYPIFGMVTKVAEDSGEFVTIEINYNIIARVNVSDVEKINLLRERAFESGIFVVKIIEKEPQVVVDCKTIIFGKKQSFSA